MKHPTPIRDGNWHVVKGELVDIDKLPPPKKRKPYARREIAPPTPDPIPALPDHKEH